jgi:uncharacterized protein
MTETTTPAAILSPVARADRILSLDVVRGLAVLGILAVNAMTFFWPHGVLASPTLQPGWDADAVSGWLIHDVFFRDKMRTLFSMLFGVSIFLVGGERSDRARGSLLRSRLFWLGLIGLIHGMAFWYGDILLLYALTGFLVLLARSWRARTLLIVGTLLYLVLGAAYFGMIYSMTFMPAEQLQEAARQQGAGMTAQELTEAIGAMTGDAWSVTVHQFWDWVSVAPIVAIAMIPVTASLMMIGLGLFKTGFLAGRAPAWVYLASIAVAAGCLYLIWGETTAIEAGGFDFIQTSLRPYATFLVPLVSLGYASVLMLMVRYGLRLVLFPLISVGRMAFTNYLTQTLIMTTLAYGGRGLGWYGEVGWPDMWGIIIVVWILQLVWSPMWLTFFRMGPIEWIWRSLTYGRLLPLSREAVA